MCKLLEEYIDNGDNRYDVRLWCWTHYGTSLRAMYTMYEITLAGCWPNYVRPLFDHVSAWYVVFFVFYITFVVFAVIRIITAIFLKETLDAANNDASVMIAEKTKKRKVFLKKLTAVFEHADVSGDGVLSYDELVRIFKDPAVRTYFSALELDVHEVSMLFDVMDNGDGSITYDEFIQGVTRLRGQARGLDVVVLQRDIEKLRKEVRGVTRTLSNLGPEGQFRVVNSEGVQVSFSGSITEKEKGLASKDKISGKPSLTPGPIIFASPSLI